MANYELHITSPFPPSVNHYMGHRAILKNGKPIDVPYKTADAVFFCRDFSKIVKDAVAEQGWDVPLDGSKHVYVDGVFYFPRKRMDCNNYWKVLLDTISKTQVVWKDDDTVCERAQGIYFDTQNPRIELTIHPVEYIGIFANENEYENFKLHCSSCTRSGRNCSIFNKAMEGRIQPEIHDGVCEKYTEKKG